MSGIRYVLYLVLLLTAPLAVADEREAINRAVDAFHKAAADSDYDAYVALMTEEVVFLGTDGSERWQGEAFREFVRPRFESGKGWEYLPLSRNIDLTGNGAVAWFDEALQNESLGHCRGSGMLLRQDGNWRIAQYNLSVPIPNDLVDAVVVQISEFESGATSPEAPGETGASAKESGDSSSGCSRRRHKTNRKAGC
ncbi:MAG: nuclear transport factor 2 family protein [Halieaceae bacterium]